MPRPPQAHPILVHNFPPAQPLTTTRYPHPFTPTPLLPRRSNPSLAKFTQDFRTCLLQTGAKVNVNLQLAATRVGGEGKGSGYGKVGGGQETSGDGWGEGQPSGGGWEWVWG